MALSPWRCYTNGPKLLKDPLVNQPPHYCQGGIEAIAAIEASMPPDGFKYFLQGQVLKYMWRYQHKGKPVQDLQKAKWYLDLLLSRFGDED